MSENVVSAADAAGTTAVATNVAVAAVATNFWYFFGWLAVEKFPPLSSKNYYVYARKKKR